MRSKLVLGCVVACACAVWWTGCSGDTVESGSTTDAGSSTPEAGSGTETGVPESSTKDAPVDTGLESSTLSGPFVAIEYGAANCPAFTPCGGDEKGLWKVKGGCVTEAIFEQAKGACPALVEKNVKFEARGTVNADGVNIERKVELKFSATFEIPASCKQANPLGQTCAAAQQGLLFAGLKTASCKDAAAGGGCDCDVTNELGETTKDTYTVSGNTLTSGTPARTFDYCVAGTDITYQETTDKAVPAIFVLAK